MSRLLSACSYRPAATSSVLPADALWVVEPCDSISLSEVPPVPEPSRPTLQRPLVLPLGLKALSTAAGRPGLVYATLANLFQMVTGALGRT